MNTATIIDRHGNTIDDDVIVPDGATLRIPAPFMDSAVTAALAKVFGDSARGGNGNSRVLHDGTGNVSGFRPGFAFSNAVPFAHQRRVDTARAGYIDDLSNAWRNPPITQPEPVLPTAKPRSHRDGESAYNAYVRDLSNAWKTAT